MSGPIGSKGDKGIYNMDENVHRLATILTRQPLFHPHQRIFYRALNPSLSSGFHIPGIQWHKYKLLGSLWATSCLEKISLFSLSCCFLNADPFLYHTIKNRLTGVVLNPKK